MIGDDPWRPVGQRVAVVALFFTFGLLVATWAVYLPGVKQTLATTNSGLGAILLASGLGAIAGMQICGRAIDRYGSVPAALIGAAAMPVVLFLPLMAASLAGAVAGAASFGVAMGTTDVGMNAAAIEVERRYRRPIMASFHAFFSIGTVCGALAGAAIFATEAGFLATALACSAAGAVLTTAAAISLRGTRLRQQREKVRTGSADATGRRRVRLGVLGALAFLLFLAEGSAMDWSSLHTQQHLHGTPAAGAVAVGAFVTAMTLGRLTADRIAARIGPVLLLRVGSLLAAGGFVIVMVAPTGSVALLGWSLAGVGLAGGVPQVFTAAGSLTRGSGRSLSRVIGIGYVALLAGPAGVGGLADRVSLNTALLVPLCAALLCAALSGAVSSTAGADRD